MQTAATEPIIETENIQKTFVPALSYGDILRCRLKTRKPIVALKNISLTIPARVILGILGPNGAGKTTLLKTIATLILPDSGTIKVKGYYVGWHDNEIKSCIGLASSDERNFYWRLSGRQNLEFFGQLYGINRKQLLCNIQRLCAIFGVNYLERRFDTYSTGMKRKLALMRALLHNPDILLLDEPTKSLDYASSAELQKIISNEAKGGKTIIMATHDIRQAQNLCNYVLILIKGTVRAFATIEALKKQFGCADLADIYLKLSGND